MKTLTNPREARGLEILSGPENIKEIQPNVWYVQSQSKNGYYRVTRQWIKTRHQWKCDCPDCTYRKVTCKHIYAVQFSLKLKEEIEKESAPRALVAAENSILCPVCQSVNIVRYGYRKTTFGEVQRFGCKDCGYKFTEDKGFKHMKHDPKVITLALDLYFKGVSLRKIADHLKQFHDITIAQTTPMRWIKKYLKLLSKYVEKNQVDVGKIWHSDEMTVFIKKNGEKKYYEWIWNIMDSKTRYLLACQVTKNRFVEDAKKPLKQAKKIADKRPDIIVTDGLQAYNDAIRQVYFDRSALFPNPHLRLKDFQTKPNNNIVERLNGTFRERSKILRSLPDQESASEFCSGMQTYYNYIRPHQGIGGLIPAQVAGIPLDFTGNRWMRMIELASEK